MGGSPNLNNEVQYFQELVILGNGRVLLFHISSYTYLSGAVVHLYLNCYTYEKDCEKTTHVLATVRESLLRLKYLNTYVLYGNRIL